MKFILVLLLSLFVDTAYAETCSYAQPAGGFPCDSTINCTNTAACPPNTHPRTVGDVLNNAYIWEGRNHVQQMRAWPGCVCVSDTTKGQQDTLRAKKIADKADRDSCALAPNRRSEANCAGHGDGPCDQGGLIPPPGFTVFQSGHYTPYLVRLCDIPSPGWGETGSKDSVTTGLFVTAYKAGNAPDYVFFNTGLPRHILQNGILTTHRCEDVIVQVFAGVGTPSTTGAVVTMGTKSCVTGPSDTNGTSYCLLENVNQEADGNASAPVKATLGNLSTDTGATDRLGSPWTCPNSTPAPTATATPTPSATPAPSGTPGPGPGPGPTISPRPSPSATASPSPSASPLPPTTPTPTSTITGGGNHESSGDSNTEIANRGGCGFNPATARHASTAGNSAPVAYSLPLTLPLIFVGYLRRKKK